MDQQHVARQPRRRGHFLLEVVEDVIVAARFQIAEQRRHGDFVLEADHREVAIGLRCCLGDGAAQIAAVVTSDMVPDHFHAILRNRECVVAIASEVGQTVTLVDRCYVQRTALGRLIDFCR
ncbi:hypothetical protein D3C81_1276470 [compost metagenome]